MTYTKGLCTRCDLERLIVNKHFYLCDVCNKKRLEKPDKKKRKRILPKPTGEAELFKQIWESRKHVSFVSGTNLGNELNVWYFAHVLPKSTYPKFRLNSENIVLLTPSEHVMYDHQTDKAKSLPEFSRLFELREMLIEKYHNK